MGGEASYIDACNRGHTGTQPRPTRRRRHTRRPPTPPHTPPPPSRHQHPSRPLVSDPSLSRSLSLSHTQILFELPQCYNVTLFHCAHTAPAFYERLRLLLRCALARCGNGAVPYTASSSLCSPHHACFCARKGCGVMHQTIHRLPARRTVA